MPVVIVESPSKAKTINKYLGKEFEVFASFGHIRDLPKKEGSVDPDNGFEMSWLVDPDSNKRLKDIEKALKNHDQLILATDPDREGEAISWHIQDELEKRGKLKGKDVQRVVFNEITKNRGKGSVSAPPRNVDRDLVDAYMARRALDYLVGFNLSSILWRKLPGSRSAGRVQSVALRLISEREAEIETFVPVEYWDVIATLNDGKSQQVAARLTHLDGKKLTKFYAWATKPTRPQPRTWSKGPRRSACWRSSKSSASRTRPRLSPPPPCSKKPAANSVSPPLTPCAWRKSCTKAWTLMVRPWA